MKREMAFVLSKSRQRREYEEQKEQKSTHHDVSFRRRSRLFKRSVTGNGQRTSRAVCPGETAAAQSRCASPGSKRTFAVCGLRQDPVKSSSRLQKPGAQKSAAHNVDIHWQEQAATV